MPNPKGKPENLEPHQFTTDRGEPLVRNLAIRIDETTYQRLQQLHDKAEFCRDAIKKALDERDNKAS
jgi:hypothetical protein